MAKKIILTVVAIAVIIGAVYGVKALVKKDPYQEISPDSITAQGQALFATINMVKINESADALKELSDKRIKLTKELEKQAKSTEEKLVKERKELESKASVLAQDVLQKKAAQYQQQVMDFQKEMAEKANSIETNYRTALQEVQDKYLNEIIEKIAKKKGVTIVLNSAQVINFNPALDITDDVIKVLNSTVKSVSMKTPKGL